jgi:hypothetical protein
MKSLTMEDLLRGPIVRCFKPENGITATDYTNAIDLHVIPALALAYGEILELSSEMDDNNREEASVYLSVMRNAIILLARMGDEVIDYQKQKGINRKNGSVNV